MKTLTIEWLNKCRCGNKLHTVKTARGNESALWDDDAVKCDSCGRGGVIQVCEGQARVLWETDEEMVEGKPMSTITKEWLQQKIADMEAIRDDIPFGLGEDGANTLAALRIALARPRRGVPLSRRQGALLGAGPHGLQEGQLPRPRARVRL